MTRKQQPWTSNDGWALVISAAIVLTIVVCFSFGWKIGLLGVAFWMFLVGIANIKA